MRMPAKAHLIILLWVLASTAALAEKIVWPGQGTISFDVPRNWTLIGNQFGGVTYNFKARPNSQAAALLQITLVNTPPDKPVDSGKLNDQLHNMVQPYLAGSVEKQFLPQELALKHGHGWFVQFTDASLVGKPPVRDDYKVMRNALLALDNHALVVVTMQYDNPKSPEPAEMLALVASMQFSRGTQSGQLASSQSPDEIEFTVPESKLRLKIPAKGMVQDTIRLGGATDNPRYFKLSRLSPNLILSGWFEPARRYKGLKEFWASESKGLRKSSTPPPQNVALLKVDSWDVVACDCDFHLDRGSNSHIRAELVQADTWIDLHLSITADQPASVSREAMLATLRTIRVEMK